MTLPVFFFAIVGAHLIIGARVHPLPKTILNKFINLEKFACMLFYCLYNTAMQCRICSTPPLKLKLSFYVRSGLYSNKMVSKTILDKICAKSRLSHIRTLQKLISQFRNPYTIFSKIYRNLTNRY